MLFTQYYLDCLSRAYVPPAVQVEIVVAPGRRWMCLIHSQVAAYTVLWNRTRCLGLCIVLHASSKPAQDQLILMTRDKACTDVLDAPDWAILGVYVIAVLMLIALTGGRLGKPADAR